MNLSNFIEKYKVSPKVCDGVIEYFKKNKEYKLEGHSGGGGVNKSIKDSMDVAFINSSQNINIIPFFKSLDIAIKEYANKYQLQENIKTSEINNIQYYKPGGGYPVLHYERSYIKPHRQLSYMLYLNTVKDKGGTKFPFQDLIISAIKGDLYIWPADFTHPHHGVISNTEEKYIATGWFEIV